MVFEDYKRLGKMLFPEHSAELDSMTDCLETFQKVFCWTCPKVPFDTSAWDWKKKADMFSFSNMTTTQIRNNLTFKSSFWD
jgi:hypothetical protein